ncbi:MAG TPA: hypothetical protein VNN22_01530 [Verrucomicrobiae bacterium]|nr:hypothetical protein [Verrucomicrobiae bacterium]
MKAKARAEGFGLVEQEGETTRDRHRVQPDDDDLSLVQAACAGGVARKSRVGAEQFFKILEQEISGNQRPNKQDAKEHPNKDKKIHAFKMLCTTPSRQIQTATFLG